MVRDKRYGALEALVDKKDTVCQILTNIRANVDDVRPTEHDQQQLLVVFEKLVGEYESAVHATRGYVHAPRSRQNLSKSCDKLKEYLEKFIKPYLLGQNGGIRPPELDYCVEDVFPTSFNQELQALVDDSQVRSEARQTNENDSSGWGGSSQEDHELEDTTRTSSETVVGRVGNGKKPS